MVKHKKLMLDSLLIFGLILFFINQEPTRADGLRTAGDILQIALPTTALGMTLSEPDNTGTQQWLESFVTTTVVTQTLKYSINRERPNGGDLSFPSGHTSSAFHGAAFIHRRYGDQYAIPAYLLASLVGYSRVDAGVHYWSDVLAGAAIGIAASFYWASDRNSKSDSMFLPIVDSNTRTFGISYIKSF
jgi:membrane-associated phospholipid phosphatase